MEGSIPGLKKVINKPFPQTIALTINAGIGSRGFHLLLEIVEL